MNRTARRLLVTTVAAGAAVTMMPSAANATIHEIVAQYCSGKEPIEPRGISTFGKKNFARPVLANGVVSGPVMVDGAPTFVIDEDHPANKVVVVGYFTTPDGVRVPIVAPDPAFPAFQHCPAVAP